MPIDLILSTTNLPHSTNYIKQEHVSKPFVTRDVDFFILTNSSLISRSLLTNFDNPTISNSHFCIIGTTSNCFRCFGRKHGNILSKSRKNLWEGWYTEYSKVECLKSNVFGWTQHVDNFFFSVGSFVAVNAVTIFSVK